MRVILISITMSLLCNCTKPNKDFCCATEAQCQAAGVSDLRPCNNGLVCDPTNKCVAPECTTSDDCTSSGAPICLDGLCVATCTIDTDCASTPGKPFCESDGTCVECKDASQCPMDAAICDGQTHACRGCELDNECASGVCVEATGQCADQTNVVFVAQFGSDSGQCTKSAPCATISGAIQKANATRNVIHIDGGMLSPQTSTIVVDKPVIIDGTGTQLISPTNMPLFSVGIFGVAVIEGVAMSGPSSGSAITVGANTTLKLSNVMLVGSGSVDVNTGALEISKSKFSNAPVNCTNGTLTSEESTFENATVTPTNCQVTIKRSRLDNVGSRALYLMGGLATIENNLFIERYELGDSALVRTVGPGSVIRFNTWVNTATIASDGEALDCDSTVEVTSNVFAYGSMHPHGAGDCHTKYSLYDTIAIALQTSGTGNKVADAATFFVNKSTEDFRLAASSPAKGSAEPGLMVGNDFDGSPRPQPVGSIADMGAFEAP